MKSLVPLRFRGSSIGLNQEFFNNLFRHGGYVLLITATERISFFLTFLVIARTTQPSSYGLMTTVFAFCTMLQVVFESGMTAYFQRESADPQKDISLEISSALLYRSYLFIPFVAISLLYFRWDASVDLIAVLGIAVTAFTLSINGMLVAVFYGRSLFKRAFILVLISRVILVVLVFMFAIFKFPVVAFVLAILVSSLIHFAFLSRTLHRLEKFSLASFNWVPVRRILRSSLPIGIGLMLVALYDRVDVLFIQKMISLEAVAAYAVAYSLYKLPLVLSGVVLVPAYTTFSNEFAHVGSISATTVKKMGLIQLGISLTFAAVISVFAGSLLSIFYGSQYISSAVLLSLIVVALPAIFLNNFTGVVLNSMRKERQPLVSTAIGALTNVGVNIILIPRFGILGAVIATIVTEYVVLFCECWYVWRNRLLLK